MADEGSPTAEDGSHPAPLTPPAQESAGQAVRGMFRRDMERREQLVGFLGSGLAIVLGIATAIAISNEHTHPKGQVGASVVLGATIAFGVALWLAARHGSRVITAVVSMAGALLALQGVIGFPYIALAGWLLVRNSRSMREQRLARTGTAARGGAARPVRGERSTGADRADRADRPARLSRRARREEAAAEAQRVERNKRYTPPGGRRRGRR